MVLVADDDRRRDRRAAPTAQPSPAASLLADQRQQLLGIQLARQWPQPRAGAAGQDHGNQHRFLYIDARNKWDRSTWAAASCLTRTILTRPRPRE